MSIEPELFDNLYKVVAAQPPPAPSEYQGDDPMKELARLAFQRGYIQAQMDCLEVLYDAHGDPPAPIKPLAKVEP